MKQLLCECCRKPEPADGWYAGAGSVGLDGELDMEVYCSPECFNSHSDGTCGCSVAEDEEFWDEFYADAEDAW